MQLIQQGAEPAAQFVLARRLDHKREQLAQFLQHMGGCRRRGGGTAAQPPVQRDRGRQIGHAEPEHGKLGHQPVHARRRDERQEHKQHRVSKIPLGVELRALRQHKHKRHADIEHDARRQAARRHIGQRHQRAADNQQAQGFGHRVIRPLVARLEKHGDDRYDQHILQAEQRKHQPERRQENRMIGSARRSAAPKVFSPCLTQPDIPMPPPLQNAGGQPAADPPIRIV